MKRRQTFLKGVLLLTAAGIAVKLIGFVYRVILTNLPGYGDEGNGIYGAGYQVYLLLFALSTTGFPSAISKLVAEKTAVGDWRGAHRIFKVSFWLLFFTGLSVSIIFFLSAGAISKAISNERTAMTMMALAPTIFFVSLMSVFRGYFQGMQDMIPQANSQVIEQLSKTCFTIFFACILLPYGIEYAAAGATAGTTIGAAVGAFYLWRLYNRRKVRIWADIRRVYRKGSREGSLKIVAGVMKLSLPISMGAVVLNVGNLIDLGTVMGGLSQAGFDSDTANRMYGILTGKCYVLSHFPVTVSAALATTLVPAIAASVARNDYKIAAYKISTSLRLSMLIGLPSSVGMALLADPLLKLLFPGSSDGAFLLAASAFTIVFAGLTQTLSGVLQGLGHSMVPAAGFFAGAVVKLAVNYTLVPIPDINIKGAVYGSIACYAAAVLVNIIFLKRNFRLNLGMYNFIIKPLAATIIMGFSVFYTNDRLLAMTGSNAVSLFAAVFCGIIVFSISIILLGVVTENDISLLPFGHNIIRVLRKVGILRS